MDGEYDIFGNEIGPGSSAAASEPQDEGAVAATPAPAPSKSGVGWSGGGGGGGLAKRVGGGEAAAAAAMAPAKPAAAPSGGGGASFAAGDLIEVKEGGSKYRAGVVTAVDGANLEVKYHDDGEVEAEIPVGLVRRRGSGGGDSGGGGGAGKAALPSAGGLSLATGVGPVGTLLDPVSATGSSAAGSPSPALPLSGLSEGARVEARYRGKSKWYAGKVGRAHADGTYDVDYDDGEAERNVRAELVRPSLGSGGGGGDTTGGATAAGGRKKGGGGGSSKSVIKEALKNPKVARIVEVVATLNEKELDAALSMIRALDSVRPPPPPSD